MIKTKVIDNFTGSMTPQINGDMNSGQSYWLDVFGYDPFTKPRNLTWNETQTQIDSGGSIITDLVMAGKVRNESGIIYVYAIGHLGRLYKIQVNDPTIFNPNYDNPVLLATLTGGSPTFTRGAFIDFFGSTERIYISHDKGVTRINFDGTSETVVGVEASWTQNVPKPLQQFLGALYIGHGTNLARIDSTATVTTYAQLSPALPVGFQIRDIDLSLDGTYLQMVVTNLALSSLIATTPDTGMTTPSNSYLIQWNGIDTGYTSSTFFNNTILTSSILSGDSHYIFGYDNFSNVLYNPIQKLVTSLPDVVGGSTLPNAVFSTGNLVYWAQTLTYLGADYALFQCYGSLADQSHPEGFWTPHFLPAVSPETDIIQIPMFMLVSSLGRGGTVNGYASGIYGVPKVYYSTLEISSTTTTYRFYKWSLYPTGLSVPINGALFQTQNQVFSKKINVKEVRVYGQPWVTNNIFTIDLIGSNDAVINGGTQTFTAGTNLTVGEDFAWFNPAMEPIYSLALRITNTGTVNHIINKVEIDYTEGGK